MPERAAAASRPDIAATSTQPALISGTLVQSPARYRFWKPDWPGSRRSRRRPGRARTVAFGTGWDVGLPDCWSKRASPFSAAAWRRSQSKPSGPSARGQKDRQGWPIHCSAFCFTIASAASGRAGPRPSPDREGCCRNRPPKADRGRPARIPRREDETCRHRSGSFVAVRDRPDRVETSAGPEMATLSARHRRRRARRPGHRQLEGQGCGRAEMADHLAPVRIGGDRRGAQMSGSDPADPGDVVMVLAIEPEIRSRRDSGANRFSKLIRSALSRAPSVSWSQIGSDGQEPRPFTVPAAGSRCFRGRSACCRTSIEPIGSPVSSGLRRVTRWKN